MIACEVLSKATEKDRKRDERMHVEESQEVERHVPSVVNFCLNLEFFLFC